MSARRDATPESVVPGRQLIWGQRPEHVEFVPVWVSHDHPADGALADADPPGAERLEPGDLGGLVGGTKIKVEPVLDGLALGNPKEQEVGNDAILGAALRRLEADLILFLPGPAPAQRRLPEAGDPGRVSGVKAQALDTYLHVPILPR